MFIRINDFASARLHALLKRVVSGEISVDVDTEQMSKDVISKIESNMN